MTNEKRKVEVCPEMIDGTTIVYRPKATIAMNEFVAEIVVCYDLAGKVINMYFTDKDGRNQEIKITKILEIMEGKNPRIKVSKGLIMIGNDNAMVTTKKFEDIDITI